MKPARQDCFQSRTINRATVPRKIMKRKEVIAIILDFLKDTL